MKKAVRRKENSQRYALLSVWDKTGIVELAKQFEKLGYQVLSSGGTEKTLTDHGVKVIPIQKITGNPEAFDGRMKTISFQVESGILFDRTKISHIREARKLGVPSIDVVICNFYPFRKTVETPSIAIDNAVENIDVGGPTMVRAAAKNFKHVLVITDPGDYELVARVLKNGKVNDKLRQKLAAKAFRYLSFYDAQVAYYLEKDHYPQEFALPLERTIDLRYGDNPDQNPAVLYLFPWAKDSPLSHLRKLAGRDLSATNIMDIDAGYKAVREFTKPTAVVIKHNSPCGIALGKNIAEALTRALESDPESAFGGVVVCNKPVDLACAKVIENFKKLGKGQMDIIAAPSVYKNALLQIEEIRKSTGVYAFGKVILPKIGSPTIKAVEGGMVFQPGNDPEASFSKWKVVTVSKPTAKQLDLMKIGWKFASRIRSNTVLVVDRRIPMTRGIGSGQTSRVLATKIALERAEKYAKGGILVSDSFFPFDDSVKLAIKTGIGAIVQQGGSINDSQSILTANRAKMPMVFTGQRVFWH